jgi:hypothetical protein
MAVTNFHIRKFDPTTIAPERVVVIIGKRNTGKSVLIKDLMNFKKSIPAGVVCSGTEEGNGYFKSWVPDIFIYNDFDKSAVERLIERQRRMCKKYGKAQNAFVILDDCMYDKKFLREKCIRSLFMNGRHWSIFLLMSAQYMMDLPPDLRTNIDYVFVLRENIMQNRERLWKAFFGIFPTFDMFCSVLNECTENFECLVLDNTSKSNRIEDVVFWYKADPARNFKLGSREAWDFHRRKYDPRHDENDQERMPGKKKKVYVLKHH